MHSLERSHSLRSFLITSYKHFVFRISRVLSQWVRLMDTCGLSPTGCAQTIRSTTLVNTSSNVNSWQLRTLHKLTSLVQLLTQTQWHPQQFSTISTFTCIPPCILKDSTIFHKAVRCSVSTRLT